MAEIPNNLPITANLAVQGPHVNMVTTRNYLSCKSLLTVPDASWDLAAADRISPSVVPIFEYPVGRWAQQIIKVLNAAGVQNYSAPKLSRYMVPILLSRLPNELTDIIPM